MVETEIEASPKFDEPGYWLCLDFTHTLEERPSDHPQEQLKSYSDLVAWGLYMHLLTDEQAQHLYEEAGRNPAKAAEVLHRGIDARELMYRVFYEIAEDSSPAESDLITLNDMLSDTMSHARIVAKWHGYEWGWVDDEHALDQVIWPVIRSAADLLASDELDAVRACAADDCRWLFLDTSKNRSRRWCDMKSCGNRAKARRHYGKKKSSSVDW